MSACKDTSRILTDAIDAIARLRGEGAHIHSITNTVAQNFTANVLLACGARPSMTINPDEVEAFVARADGVHLNLGTLDASRIAAIEIAVFTAEAGSKPILLDPVMAHVSPIRAEFSGEIVDRADIIRGNKNEISALGLDKETNACVVMTGERDQVLYKDRTCCIDNGDPIMAQVIATGCALGGLITALSTKTDCPQTAGIAGLIWFGVAGEIAAGECNGPGSFAPTFIDTLHNVDADTLREKARIS